MKLTTDIEVPAELEGALHQVAAKYGIKPAAILEIALTHALRRVCGGMRLEQDFAQSLSDDVSVNQFIKFRASQLILHIEKAVADSTALTNATASLLGVKVPGSE